MRNRTWMRRLTGLLVLGAVCFTLLGSPVTGGRLEARAEPAPATGKAVPVFAYFYQWFDPTSWRRAKQDFPLAGRYSSDDEKTLRTQVQQASAAGIHGFLTSWKSTATLNRRLDLLVRVATPQGFDLGVVYEALDFQRRPLPVATVRSDLVHLVTRWGSGLRSRSFDRPLVIWTGTDQYSVADVQAVRAALGHHAYLLAASKSVAGYLRIADHVDGEAYYWSSANPSAPGTLKKLSAMGEAVHAHHGIWLAPGASGFDGRTLGHSRVIDRKGGQTLVKSLDNAFASAPDAVGVISWNEWSENTYIEPGERYGSQELNVLRTYLEQQQGLPAHRVAAVPSQPRSAKASWNGLQATVLLSVITLVAVLWLTSRRRSTGFPDVVTADRAVG